VASGKQLNAGVGANVASSAGDQNHQLAISENFMKKLNWQTDQNKSPIGINFIFSQRAHLLF
jgi:hypothetical protein